MTKTNNCPDCGVSPGQQHLNGCDVERCPTCGDQYISCCCDDGHDKDTDRIVWSGEWPGIAECHEFGWYAKKIPGRGWVECCKDDHGATEDLNRLALCTTWSKELKSYIKDDEAIKIWKEINYKKQ